MNTNEIATKSDISRLEIQVNKLKQLIESNFISTSQKPFLSGKEIKEILGISEGTLKSYRAKEYLPAKKIGGKYYYRYDDMIKLVERKDKD